MNIFTLLSVFGFLNNFMQRQRQGQPQSQPQTSQTSNVVSSADLNNFVNQIANYKGRLR